MTSVIGFDMPMSIHNKKPTLNNQDMVQHCEFKKNNAGKLFKRSIKNSILIFISFISLSINSFGQILTFDFSGIVGNEITSNSNSNNPNISSSTISRGAGLTASGNTDRFNATNWAGTSIAIAISGNDYMEFTITPNAGCNFSISSISIQLQRSGTGPSAIVLRSSIDAFATDLDAQYTIADITTTQTFTFTFSQSNISAATTYRFYMYAEAGTGSGGIGDGAGNDIIVNGTTGGCSTNTITTGTLLSAPFSVDCAAPAAGSIAFTSTGTFIGGNNYVAQLSNASGSFASPTTIGSLASIANSGSISISIPSATATGAGYLIRIISTTPAIISNSSAAFSINLTGGPCTLVPPYITSMLYDGCNVSCGASSEGMSEISFGNTNDYSLAVNATNVTLNYLSGGYIMTSTIVNNAATTSALNTAAGCAGLFVDAFGTTLPTNASFMLVSNALCVSALVWNNLCGTGPIYVVYAGNGVGGATWRDGGNFGNSGGAKSFSTTFVTTDASVNTLNYAYTAPGGGTDGNYATWGSSGGTALTQGNLPGCSITPVVLPSSLISFQGTYINSKSQLTWQTASEQNNSHFTLSHSTDGYQFDVIGTVAGSGNSTDIRDYRFIHNYPHPGMNYYKLKSTDYDGKEYSKGIVAIEAEFNFSFYNSVTSTIELSYESDIEIFSMDGKLIQSSLNTSSVPFTKSGMFFIYDKKTGISERLFIP